MKLILTILFLGILQGESLGQKTDTKTILLISTKYFGLCAHVAFRVTKNNIEIDNCYDYKIGIFKPRKIIELDSEPALKKIFSTPILDLKMYEEKINASKCDYIAPIVFKIVDREIETIIEWKGIQNCYPEPMKNTILELEQLFEKYK